MTLNKVYEKCKKIDPSIWIASYVVISALLLYFYPPMQVAHFELNNSTSNANFENQYRATLTQILAGFTAAIGVYFAWKDYTSSKDKIAEENLKLNQMITQENIKIAIEGQITERFTKAIDQLGNNKIETRLGGIYALERISQESQKNYWPIMEILTAFVRINSNFKTVENKIPIDIQAALAVINRRPWSFNNGESIRLDLQETQLIGAHLEMANLKMASFSRANLEMANLKAVNLEGANLEMANLKAVNLEGANLEMANLEGANLEMANLEGANLEMANLKAVNLEGANLKAANLNRANLRETLGLSLDQLSKVKTLYKAILDEELEKTLKANCPALFVEPVL